MELDATLQPTDRFTVRLALNWLDARYDEYAPAYNDTTVTPNVRRSVNFAGRPLNRSPKWSWIAGVNYVVPVGDGKIVADAQTSARSRYEVTDLANFAYFYQPAATKTDLSLTYNAPEDRFYVAGFVENLENNLIVTGASTGLFGSVTFADPRTYGVRAGFKF